MRKLLKNRYSIFSVAVFLIVFGCIFFQSPANVFAVDANTTTIDSTGNGTFTTTSGQNVGLSFKGQDTTGLNYFNGTDGKTYTVQSTGQVLEAGFWNDGWARLWDEINVVSGTDLFNKNKMQSNNGECVFSNLISGTLWNCLVQAEYYLLYGLSYVVNVVVSLFDVVFEITVVKISDAVKNIKAIQTGWTAVRDLANICFIFILLYLAIATILQLDEHGVKHSLSRLIIAAMLINFSLFFTKVIIDIPNILSIEIYNKIVGSTDGVGSAFFSIIKPEKINNSTSITGLVTVGSAPTLGSTASQTDAANYAKTGSSFTTFIMMIILYFFICIVFLAATIIFIKRFVMLIFLMIFSPLAFAAMAMPGGSSIAKSKFWDVLIKEAFYAPIFMLCIYIAYVTGQSAYITAPTTNTSYIGSMSYVIFNFTVVIVMLVASLMIAEQMGVKGAGGAMGMFNKMKGWGMGAVKWTGANTGGRLINTGLRATVGSAAYNLLEGKGGEGSLSHRFVLWRTKAKSGAKGGLARVVAGASEAILKKGVHAKVGTVGHDFEEEVAEKMAGIASHAYEIKDDPKALAKYYSEMSRKGAKDRGTRVAMERHWEDKMDTKGQAEVLVALADQESKARANGLIVEATAFKESAKHLRGRFSVSEADAVDRASEGALEYHRHRFNEVARPIVVARENHKKAVEAHVEAVQTHGAGSAQAITAHTEMANRETQLNRVMADATVQAPIQNYYNSLNVNQKVGLRPEQFSMPFLHRDGHELEQIQRKSNISSAQRAEIEQSIETDLDKYLAKISATPGGWAGVAAQEQADIKDLVNYMNRNGKTWYSGKRNMDIVKDIVNTAPTDTFAK